MPACGHGGRLLLWATAAGASLAFGCVRSNDATARGASDSGADEGDAGERSDAGGSDGGERDASVFDAPDIRVTQDATDLSKDAGAYDFGEMEVDGDGSLASCTATFTIANDGGRDLAIGDVFFQEGDTADFDMDDATMATVPPGMETSFAVRFDPQSLGERKAVVRIASDDPDEGAFDFEVAGRGVDTTGPRLVTDAIGFTDLDDRGLTVTWTKATDENTPQSELFYRVYRAPSAEVGALAELTDDEISMDWTRDVSQVGQTDLEAGTTYYFNVVVADAQGNERAYAMAGQKTMPPILLYSFEGTVALGGRAGADGSCAANRPDSVPETWSTRALLSVDETDQVSDFTSGLCAIPDHLELRGVDDADHVFADDWIALFTDGPSMSLAAAGVLSEGAHWYSGSNADGTVAANSTCNAWLGGIASGTQGAADALDGKWIQDAVIKTCGTGTGTFLCLAWE